MSADLRRAVMHEERSEAYSGLIRAPPNYQQFSTFKKVLFIVRYQDATQTIDTQIYCLSERSNTINRVVEPYAGQSATLESDFTYLVSN